MSPGDKAGQVLRSCLVKWPYVEIGASEAFERIALLGLKPPVKLCNGGLNSGVSASTPEIPPENITGRAPVFLCLKGIYDRSNCQGCNGPATAYDPEPDD